VAEFCCKGNDGGAHSPNAPISHPPAGGVQEQVMAGSFLMAESRHVPDRRSAVSM
jgi:hypothetical protein